MSDCKVAILASVRGTHFYGRITEKGASYCEILLINATICDGLQQPAFCCNTRSTKAFWLKTQAAIPQTTEPKGLGFFISKESFPGYARMRFSHPEWTNFRGEGHKFD